jgi:hypothetical protein
MATPTSELIDGDADTLVGGEGMFRQSAPVLRAAVFAWDRFMMFRL